jgi:hypothetical protein
MLMDMHSACVSGRGEYIYIYICVCVCVCVCVCARSIYTENFYFVDRFHGSALHNERCTAGYEARTNFYRRINMPEG